MGRRLRHLPYPETLVEITNRTIHGRYLLSPSEKLRDIVLGALGRAQRRYGVEIHAFVFLSNHYHLLATFRDANQMSRFVGYFQSKLAKEIARSSGWRDKIWARRFTPIPVSQEEAAHVDRLGYLLSHGVKEGFVPHPADWPGAHSVNALLEGAPLEGLWHDRTAEYQAKCRGGRSREGDFASKEVIELSPLPCWRDEPAEILRERVHHLIEEIVASAKASLKGTRRRFKAPHPSARPRRSKRSPAPWFHCASKAVRLELRRAYGEFLAAYRDAADRLRAGELTAPFPDGCFLPPRYCRLAV